MYKNMLMLCFFWSGDRIPFMGIETFLRAKLGKNFLGKPHCTSMDGCEQSGL